MSRPGGTEPLDEAWLRNASVDTSSDIKKPIEVLSNLELTREPSS